MKKAFTLIELLVVVAIIAILASVMYPVIDAAASKPEITIIHVTKTERTRHGREVYTSDEYFTTSRQQYGKLNAGHSYEIEYRGTTITGVLREVDELGETIFGGTTRAE